LGHGDGTFGSARRFSVTGSPTHLVAGDFNGDGFLDLATLEPVVEAEFSITQPSHQTVLLGAAGGTFVVQPDSPFTAQTNVKALTVANVNGDQVDDLIATLLLGQVSVLLGQDGATSLTGALLVSDAAPTSGLPALAADFNGDGMIDLAFA